MNPLDDDSDIEQLVRRAAGPHSEVSTESAVGDAVRRGRRRLVRRRLGIGAVTAAVVGLTIFAGDELLTTGPTDPLTVAAPPRTGPTTAPPASIPVAPPVRDTTITYPDGTTVTWPGPARGEGWVVHPELADELPVSPGVDLNSWDRTVPDTVFGGGRNEELGVLVGSDGELSYARSTGVFSSFVWAPGPELPDLDLDPCSAWPVSSVVDQPADGITCRVLTIDGRPVVVAEQLQQGSSGGTSRPAGVTAFTVRPDGTAVFLSQSSVDGEPVLPGEDLARAALTLAGP